MLSSEQNPEVCPVFIGIDLQRTMIPAGGRQGSTAVGYKKYLQPQHFF